MKKIVLLCSLCVMFVAGCSPQSKTQSGAIYGTAGGAAAGAILGQAIGRDTEGTLYGAAIGAALGGLAGAGAGKMMDNQEREMRQALAESEAAAVRREGNLLAITLRGDVTFDTNSAIVRPGLYSEIDRISSVLRQYTQTVIRVEGHTDSIGTEAYNKDLSQRRANSVKTLFVQRGVEGSRIESIGFGESMPVATNDTESGRQMNRRVEIKVAPSQY
ncbi:MAG: OmpA family protein [Thermodesulfobacteriota bacterium]